LKHHINQTILQPTSHHELVTILKRILYGYDSGISTFSHYCMEGTYPPLRYFYQLTVTYVRCVDFCKSLRFLQHRLSSCNIPRWLLPLSLWFLPTAVTSATESRRFLHHAFNLVLLQQEAEPGGDGETYV